MFKIFDSYKLCAILALALIVVAVGLSPYATGTFHIGTFTVPLGPIIVLLPVLGGVSYLVILSTETAKMSERKKDIHRIAKAITFIVVYVLEILAILKNFMR